MLRLAELLGIDAEDGFDADGIAGGVGIDDGGGGWVDLQLTTLVNTNIKIIILNEFFIAWSWVILSRYEAGSVRLRWPPRR